MKNKVKPYCNSEIGVLEEVILCSPTLHNVIGPEVESVGFAQDFIAELAIEQHMDLKIKLESFGCRVHDVSTTIDSQLWNRLVNRIFVRDVAAVFGDKLILGNSGTDVRKADFYHTQSVLSDFFDKKQILPLPTSITLEFGDFLIINQNSVLINIGHRSNNKIELVRFLFELGIEEIGFISLPRTTETLHLDVVCNILGENTFIAASFMKFSPVTVHKKNFTEEKTEYTTIDDFISRHGYSISWLPNKSYLIDYTNFINLDNKTAMVSDNSLPYYQDRFRHINFIGVNVDHLQNGAGGIRCLTMPFVRNSI